MGSEYGLRFQETFQQHVATYYISIFGKTKKIHCYADDT